MTLVDFNILAVMSLLLGRYITIIYTTSQNVPVYLLILIGIYDYKFNEEERDWAHVDLIAAILISVQTENFIQLSLSLSHT